METIGYLATAITLVLCLGTIIKQSVRTRRFHRENDRQMRAWLQSRAAE